jgi:hypothetical protein
MSQALTGVLRTELLHLREQAVEAGGQPWTAHLGAEWRVYAGNPDNLQDDVATITAPDAHADQLAGYLESVAPASIITLIDQILQNGIS